MKQLDSISNLERPPCATQATWESFGRNIAKGRRLADKHHVAFDPLTIHEARDVVARVEMICRTLYNHLEYWGMETTVDLTYKVPESLASKDRSRLDTLVAYIFLNVHCHFEDAQEREEWQ